VNPRTAAAPAELAPAARAPCLLLNPRSFGAARSGLAERAAQLAYSHGVEVIRAADSAEIGAATDRLLARRQQLVILLAGDGTVRAVVDRLAQVAAGVPRPQLLVLGGGRTNLIPGDLGGRGSVLAKLDAALRRWREGTGLAKEERYVLEIAQPAAPVRRGFFLAAGLVDYAIRACHRDRTVGSGKLRQGAAGTAWSLLKRAPPAMLGRLDPLLDELHVEVAGHGALADAAHLLIATTLQRRHGALDPYAARGRGGVRFTAVAARGPAFWARLPLVATGRFTRTMDARHGYLSGRC